MTKLLRASWLHIVGAVLIALAPELIAVGEGSWAEVWHPALVGRLLAAVGAVLYAGRKVDLGGSGSQ